jgi:DNA-binding transcriptional LysR family regulator
MRKNCEILDLKIFLAVLDLGSFHKASEALSLSQPTLTRRLQSLEETFGAKPLERTTRHLAPTRVGRELEPGIRRMVREFEDCIFNLGDHGVKPSGILTVASIPTASSAFLPHVLKRFTKLYPGIQFRIRDLAPSEGLECVARGEAEFGINSMGTSRPELKFTPLIDDEFALACRADHPLASAKALRWQDLVKYPLIVSQKSDNRMVIDQALARSNLSLNWSFQVGHLATSIGLVEAGLGMSIIPRLSRPLFKHPSIAIVPVKEPVITRTVGIIERRGRQLSRAAAQLRAMVVAGSADWNRLRAGKKAISQNSGPLDKANGRSNAQQRAR